MDVSRSVRYLISLILKRINNQEEWVAPLFKILLSD